MSNNKLLPNNKIHGNRFKEDSRTSAANASYGKESYTRKLNLSTSAYCKIEYGETDLTLTRLNKIAEVLNMSALELFNKIDGNVYVNNSGTIGTNIGVAKDCSSVHIEAADDLRELIKANSRLLDMLYKRIELLENKVLL